MDGQIDLQHPCRIPLFPGELNKALNVDGLLTGVNVLFAGLVILLAGLVILLAGLVGLLAGVDGLDVILLALLL